MADPGLEGIVFGIGSILLDMYADVDKAFLDKWSLKENEATICDESRRPIFDEIVEKYKVTFVPGGASNNAVRVCQGVIHGLPGNRTGETRTYKYGTISKSMLNQPAACSYFGIIGNDNYGQILIEEMEKEGVNLKYEINDSVGTGTCAVLIQGVHRSLCTYTSVGRLLNAKHLQRPDVWKLVNNARFLYVPGFVIVHSAETAMQLAEHSHRNGKVVVSNISATYIPQRFRESFLRLLPFVDVLFGNSDEALSLAEAENFGTKDLGQIALKISEIKKYSSGARLVVITQGSEPTVVAKNGEIRLFPVKEIEIEKIVDTSGAGDSFVGGFLSQYIQNVSLDECVRAANFAAWTIIQRRGCTIPIEGIYRQYKKNL